MAEGEKETLGVKVVAWLVVAAILPGIFLVVSAAKTLAVAVIGWFRTGAWQSPTTWEVLHALGVDERPATGWYVPDAILNWFLDGAGWFWEAVAAFVYLGIIIGAVIAGGYGLERIGKRFKRQARTN